MPVNEGISYPADDPDRAALQTISTAATASAWPVRANGRPTGSDDHRRHRRRRGRPGSPRSMAGFGSARAGHPQKGQFGSPGGIRYVFFDDGGYVAMCKRYRQSCAERACSRRSPRNATRTRTSICWSARSMSGAGTRTPVGICRRDAGGRASDRILWSNGADPETLRRLNALGVLTSRYDIYQDVMDPANFPKLRCIHPDWTTEAWPKTSCSTPTGEWLRGWEVEGQGRRDGIPAACCAIARPPDTPASASPTNLKHIPIAAGSSTRRPPRRGASAMSPDIL